MIKRICFLLLFFLFAGCASIRVVPSPDNTGKILARDLSVQQENQQVVVKSRVVDLEVRPYQMKQNICSFEVIVQNKRDKKIYFPAERFLLTDDQGQQFKPVSPEKIQKIVSQQDPYLIPYPYVGYYYEKDSQQARLKNQFNSEVTYFPYRDARGIALDALPDADIEGGKLQKGLIYFLADLRNMKFFTLSGSAILDQGVKSSDFNFRFEVSKD